MANMGYCRFSNTLKDLNDCLDAIDNRDIKSIEERDCAKTMIKAFLEFLENEEIIDGFDTEQIDSLIDECE